MREGEGASAGELPRIAVGDRDAVAAFYAKTSAQAYGLALRILDRTSLAERACESAYAEVPHLATTASSERELETMFLGRVRVISVEMLAETSTATPTVPGEPSYTIVNSVRESLATLEGTSRQALELAYYGGMSVAQIAAMLGRDEGEIRRLLREALLGLGAATREEGKRTR